MATLTDVVRETLRLSSPDDMTLEVDALVAAFKADMRRIGVPFYMLEEETPDPLIRIACMLYCKAYFGFDNSQFTSYQASYRQIVKDILNSPTEYRPYTNPVPRKREDEEVDGDGEVEQDVRASE